MLGKLIKYDFKALSRNMFPVYGLMIALTLVCSLMIRFNLDKGFVFGISLFAWVVSMSTSFFITIWMVVMRFYNGLLKNEGYLSFALPVKTETHVFAKVINALIWTLVEVAALGICAAIYILTVADLRDLVEAFKYIFTIDIDFYLSMLQGLLLLAVEILNLICLFFAAFSIAHLFEKHQKLLAGVFIVLIYILRVFMFPHRFSYEISPGAQMVVLNPLLFIVPLVLAAVDCLVTWYILDKHLNLQ